MKTARPAPQARARHQQHIPRRHRPRDDTCRAHRVCCLTSAFGLRLELGWRQSAADPATAAATPAGAGIAGLRSALGGHGEPPSMIRRDSDLEYEPVNTADRSRRIHEVDGHTFSERQRQCCLHTRPGHRPGRPVLESAATRHRPPQSLARQIARDRSRAT